MSKYGKGYIKDTLEKRAHAKSSRLLFGASPSYPVLCDQRSHELLQLDQGQTGSCTGHGTSHALQVASAVQHDGITFVASPGGIYTNTRCIERPSASTPLTDSGAMPADIMTALAAWGVKPYTGSVNSSDVTPANVNDEPDLEDLEKEAIHIITGNYRVDETATDALVQTFAGIAQYGAVGLGIFVDTAFENWDPAQGPLDKVDLNDPNGGGHWLCADYYDSANGYIGLWNSWGNTWGRFGHIEVTPNWFKAAVSDIYVMKITGAMTK